MKNELITDLKEIADKYKMSTSELISVLKSEDKIKSEAKIYQKVKENESLVGRYFYRMVRPRNDMFPQMKQFFHVISSRSENEYRVECLTFDEHPTYWFEYQTFMAGAAGDYYLGRFDFESFRVRSCMANTFEAMEEITKEEFDEYAHKYLDEMLEMKWFADHFRWGGRLPSDSGWPEEEKVPSSIRGK